MEFPPNCFHGFPPPSSSPEYALTQMIMMRGGCDGTTSSSSLVLDSEKGEIVRALVRPGSSHHHHNQKEVKAEKALMALRNHSEAERRRRERINGHLSMLRTLIPGTTKMDKASLLAEVITQLKQLRRTAAEAAQGVLIPMDTDQVKVEQQKEQEQEQDHYSITASLCCEYKHEVLSDLKEALDGLRLTTIRSEIATLGSRMVNLFVITARSKDDQNIVDVVGSVRQALKSVLDKFYASQEFSETNSLSNKRRRVSLFAPSDSPSFGEFWRKVAVAPKRCRKPWDA